jgi:Zn-dependent protease with chaperone function
MHSAASYRNMVERLEREATARPGWYRFKVLMLAVLGYGFLLASMAIALAFSLGLGLLLLLTKSLWAIKLIKLVWMPLALAWVILRALWVRLDEPTGYRLKPGDAPVLRQEVERLRSEAGAPRLSGIVIDDNLNAGAASVPRLLGLAGNRHFLVLGLPLMRALDPPQLASVIAHEFGHFGAGHSHFSGWIYRVRQSWYRVLEALARHASAGSGVFVRFFNWYAPYFNAYSFVLARNNEYQADAMAVRLAGATATGDALTKVNLAARRLQDRFWPGVDHLLLVQAEPPHGLYNDMATVLNRAEDDDRTVLTELLAHPSDFEDTHPGLAARLAAIGVEPQLPPSLQVSAAEAWLGALAEQVQDQFNEEWRNRVADHWRERHQSMAAARGQLEALERLRGERLLTPEEIFEHATLVEALLPDQPVVPLYREALSGLPEHAPVHFRLGSRLLEDGQAEGIGLMERAITLDSTATEPGLQCLGRFYHAQGDTVAMDAVRDRLRDWHKTRSKAHAERAIVRRSDTFLAHGLDAAQVQRLCDAFTRHGKIGKAWLVRKRIANDDGSPHFVLLVKWRGIVMDAQATLNRLLPLVELPGSLHALSIGGQRAVESRIKSAAGAPMFKRGWF